MKKLSLITILAVLFSGTALAGSIDGRAVLGGAIGGGTGAAVGSAVGGRNGAIVGSAIGAAAGVAIATPKKSTKTVVIREREYDDDHHDRRHYGHGRGKHRGHD